MGRIRATVSRCVLRRLKHFEKDIIVITNLHEVEYVTCNLSLQCQLHRPIESLHNPQPRSLKHNTVDSGPRQQFAHAHWRRFRSEISPSLDNLLRQLHATVFDRNHRVCWYLHLQKSSHWSYRYMIFYLMHFLCKLNFLFQWTDMVAQLVLVTWVEIESLRNDESNDLDNATNQWFDWLMQKK